jgi:hypothetical protein
MYRSLLLTAAFLAAASPARADRIAPIASPVERALRSPVVIVGKVTAIEKETVDAILYPGATNKVTHKVAVVKVETNLAGADGTTHFRVGFVPTGAAGVRPGRGPENPELAEGQEWLFFLTKSPGGEFQIIPYLTPPVDAKSEDYKAQVESVKKTLAAIADPVKALKAEKAEDRHAAAVAIVLKYRTPPEGAREIENAAVPSDESKLILKALAEGDWKFDPRGGRLNAVTAFYQLGHGEADGWKAPGPQQGVDFNEAVRTEFTKWLDGPGKDYKVKKIVPKKK